MNVQQLFRPQHKLQQYSALFRTHYSVISLIPFETAFTSCFQMLELIQMTIPTKINVHEVQENPQSQITGQQGRVIEH